MAAINQYFWPKAQLDTSSCCKRHLTLLSKYYTKYLLNYGNSTFI